MCILSECLSHTHAPAVIEHTLHYTIMSHNKCTIASSPFPWLTTLFHKLLTLDIGCRMSAWYQELREHVEKSKAKEGKLEKTIGTEE